MISLRKTSSEMERQEELLRAVCYVYGQAIRISAEYAVEFEPSALESFREQLTILHGQIAKASTPQHFDAVNKSLRRELQSYHSDAQQSITGMRRELQGAAAAMQVFAGDLSSSSAEYETQLKQEVQQLNSLSRSDDLQEIRGGVKVVAEGIGHTYEQLRRSNQLTIAQLRDEVRVLHQAMEADRQKRLVDQSSGAWNRQKITDRMELLQEQNERFCVLVVVIRNWKRLQQPHSRTVLNSVLHAAMKDLRNIVGTDSVIGRWNDEIFVTILEIASASAMALGNEVKRRLPTAYSVHEDGASHTVKLETVAGIVERQRDVDPGRFSLKLKQLMETLGSIV